MKNRIIIYSLLLILLAVSLYIRNNSGAIFAQIGSYYYKKNDIARAQDFYEKSFARGAYSARDVYVNSIINSPLTIEAQEKLVKFAEGSVQDEASARAKSFLYELKREIHRQYPLNYIKQAAHNQQIVRWNKFPVTYSFENASSVPNEYKDEIRKAFSEWEKIGAVLFMEKESGADVVINFKNNKNKNMEFGRKYVAAYTVPQISGTVLQRMDINFFIQDPEGNKFSRSQIYNTALHEIFHALGFMGHSFDKEDIMYLAKDNNTLVNDIRAELTEADKSTLKLLYKIKPDVTNSNELKSEYVPYLVLGDEEEVNVSKAREAKNYIYHAPTLPSGYVDMAESLAAEKRYPEAIRHLEKALRLADTYDMQYIVFYNLAVCYFYIDHKEMALDYLEKAREIKDSEELHSLKAEILVKTDKDGAIKEYNYLINLAPDNPDYSIRLANIYVKDYEYLKARKVLKDFLKRNPSLKKDKRFSPYGILLL